LKVWSITDKKYLDSLSFVEQLLAIDPDIIKKIRVTEPIISNITKALLLATNPAIPETLADELVKKF